MAGFIPYYSIAKRLVRLRKKPMIVNRLGTKWQLYPNDWIDNRLLIGRPFERDQLDFAQNCIRNKQVSVFFDCGANFGLYSVLMGANISDLKTIHAFEPVANSHKKLIANIALNGLTDIVFAHNYGLGARAESRTIAFDANSSGTATLDVDEQKNPKRDFKDRQHVDIRVFDQEFTETNQCAFFKLDVEGYEAEALKGMEKYLANNTCILQVELWEKNKAQVETWLGQRGYSAFHNVHHDVYFSQN